MDIFDQLLEESSFVRKQRALAEKQGLAKGEAEGLAKGKTEGEVESSQQILLDMLRKRYPMLAQQQQLRIRQFREVSRLHDAILQLMDVSSEEQALQMLEDYLS